MPDFDLNAVAEVVEVDIAKEADISNIIILGQRMHAETVYEWIRFDEDIFRKHITDFLKNSSNQRIFVHRKNGQVQGFLFGRVSQYFFSDQKIATEELFFVNPDERSFHVARKLLNAYEEWGKKLGAVECCLAVSSGRKISRIAKLYERVGYSAVGGVFKKRI